MLLPKTDKHDLTRGYSDNFFTSCMISCHSFQTRMAPTTRDEDGWRDRVNYMRNVIFGGEGEGPRLSDERVDDIAAYLTVLFGPDSPKPADPSHTSGVQKHAAARHRKSHEHRLRGI